jgi:hypothetical protein
VQEVKMGSNFCHSRDAPEQGQCKFGNLGGIVSYEYFEGVFAGARDWREMGFLRGFRGFWVWESRFWPLLGAEKPLNARVLTSFGAKKPTLGAQKPLNGCGGTEGLRQ